MNDEEMDISFAKLAAYEDLFNELHKEAELRGPEFAQFLEDVKLTLELRGYFDV